MRHTSHGKPFCLPGRPAGWARCCVKALSASQRWTVFAAGTNEAALAELGELPNVIPIRMDITSQASVDAGACGGWLAHTATLDAIANFAG